MLRHFFTIAIRNTLKHLNYSILNIAGLAIGIASFLFILIYVTDELKYDRFHEGYEQIYRMNRLYNSNDINEDAATCSFPFGTALAEDYPDMVKSMVRFFDFQVSEMMFENREDSLNVMKFNEEHFFLADSNVFQMFTFPLIKGDPLTALARPNTVVLSESTARRYFGDDPAIGKTLFLEEGPGMEITGIMKDLPPQSHFKIEILGSLSTFRQMAGGQFPQNWIWNPCWTYVSLHDNIGPEQLEATMPDFYLAHYPGFQDQDITLYLQPLADIHLQSHHEYEMHPNGKLSYVKILAAIGLIVLILACINFMNLSTASSSGRGREIGMKKVIGARKPSLVLQFLGEALLLTLMALLLGAIILELLLPQFNNFTGKQIDSGIIIQPESILIGLALLFFVGVLSGSYPAFFLSAQNTSHLKDTLSSGGGNGVARKALVVVQFLISIALIIGTISASAQLNYLKNADLGFNRDNVILLPTKFNLAMRFDAFAEELKQHPEIINVTGMEDILGADHNTRSFVIEGMFDDQPFWYPAFMVRHEFIETFGIEVIEGRGFSRDFPSDTSEAIMINESMVKHLGWTNQEAIGKAIRSDGNERVIGVFSDFNALSLHKPVDNFVLDMIQNPQGAAGLTRYMAIRVNTNNYTSVLKHIQQSWENFAPTRPFEYSFLDEELETLYRDESKFSKLSIILTILAIVIACLGLIGLTSFMVERKTKEICVRRVNGATVSDVNALLSREFLWLIFIAILVSWPLAWFGINHWLESFSTHIDVQWFVFVISALVSILITLLVTSIHAYRASIMNPADTLKYE
ncbi:MAG: FtsX-like permease family protein [Bacteroidetes bacterium]|nr:FtsX-like permease family protein [Bacteroidota bacterium]